MVFLQFEVILYEKSSVVLYPSNSSLSNPLFALVSLPQALRDIQKTAARETMVTQALQTKS